MYSTLLDFDSLPSIQPQHTDNKISVLHQAWRTQVCTCAWPHFSCFMMVLMSPSISSILACHLAMAACATDRCWSLLPALLV